MASMFYSGRIYDLKSNPHVNATQEFGNWFYGAAAARMGYTKAEALKAGALVQQVQNYTYPNHPSYMSISQLTSNLINTMITGCCDNPDDIPQIEGGYDYGSEVFSGNIDSKSDSNSCQNNETAPKQGNLGEGSGHGGGWSGRVFLGFGGCIGNCGGIPRTTIKDLPPEDKQ